MTAYTPVRTATWHVKRSTGLRCLCGLTGCDGFEVRVDGAGALIAGVADHAWGKETEGIARLIAAAPDLLAALQSLVAADNGNYQRDTMRSEGYFDAARAAIAKAQHV